MKLNKKGMTLVELIISVALLSVVLGFLFKVLLDVKYESNDAGFAINNQVNRVEILKQIQTDFETLGLLEASLVEDKVVFKFNEEEKELLVEDNKKIIYDGKKWTLKDESFKLGDIELENVIDDYIKVVIPVVSLDGENETIVDDIILFTKYKVIEKDLYFKDVILAHATENNYLYGTANLNKSTSAGEYGLYKAEDDLGDSYYFRGDVVNNYVKFGVWNETQTVYRAVDKNKIWGKDFKSLSECEAGISLYYGLYKIGGEGECINTYTYANEGDPMYWRIVRINGDGSVRLIYDGTEAVANDVQHDAAIINDYYGLTSEKGRYSFFDGEVLKSSNAKKIVDEWYVKNLKSSNGRYLADGIFCNDFSTSYHQYYNSTRKEDMYYYDAYLRSWNGMSSLKCDAGEKLTVQNKRLNYPIGLLTIDEVNLSGMRPSTKRKNFYLYTGKGNFLTMSGADRQIDENYTYFTIGVSAYGGGGGYYGLVIEDPNPSLRPVINIKAKTKVTGTGTQDDPYILQ